LAIAAAVYVVFWTMNIASNLTVVFIYSILLGNFGTFVVEAMMLRCGGRRKQVMEEVNAFCDSQLQDDATLVIIGKSRSG
jgi:hypothetical protein